MSQETKRTAAEIDAEIARLEAERNAINTCWVKGVYVEKSGSGAHCIRLPFAHLRGKSAEMHIREDAEIVHGAALRTAPAPKVEKKPVGYVLVDTYGNVSAHELFPTPQDAVSESWSIDTVRPVYFHPACAPLVAEKKLHAGDCVEYLVKEYHTDTAHRSEVVLRTYCRERDGVKYTVSVCRTADFEPNAPTGKPVAVAGKGTIATITEKFYQIIESLNDGQLTKTIAEWEFAEALAEIRELPEPSDLDAEIADQTMHEIGTWNPSNKEQMVLGVIAALLAATESEAGK